MELMFDMYRVWDDENVVKMEGEQLHSNVSVLNVSL